MTLIRGKSYRTKPDHGLVRDLNPGPLAPKARIIPLDQRARTLCPPLPALEHFGRGFYLLLQGELAQMVERSLRKRRSPIFEPPLASKKDVKTEVG
ncbi:hypothetical protein QQF64_003275 [Cirrhinus molitorella]|uniref:Uncharacterized protein n=1 Tax=Cirrhinus molitorella TaxID=172907 RepID=A0ABR3MKZ0_9TELE